MRSSKYHIWVIKWIYSYCHLHPAILHNFIPHSLWSWRSYIISETRWPPVGTYTPWPILYWWYCCDLIEVYSFYDPNAVFGGPHGFKICIHIGIFLLKTVNKDWYAFYIKVSVSCGYQKSPYNGRLFSFGCGMVEVFFTCIYFQTKKPFRLFLMWCTPLWN